MRLMAEHMKQLGFDNVRTEPTVVGHWVRGPREEGRILSRTAGAIPVKVRAIGNSIATPAGGVTAGILEVRSVAELEKVGDQARGRIVFFNGAMDPTLLDTFPAYGGAAQQRSGGAVAAARAGAVAAVVRSLTLEINDDPHTGTMSYDPAVAEDPGRDHHDRGRRTPERAASRRTRRAVLVHDHVPDAAAGDVAQRHGRTARHSRTRTRSSSSAATSTAGTSARARTTTEPGARSRSKRSA